MNEIIKIIAAFIEATIEGINVFVKSIIIVFIIFVVCTIIYLLKIILN